MDRPTAAEIIASLENKPILELNDLANLLRDRFVPPPPPPPDESAQNVDDDYWTPRYALILVGIKDSVPSKVRLIKLLRELTNYSLSECRDIVENRDRLPLKLAGMRGEHPTDCRKKLQPVREELEACGAVLDEEFNYGYYD